MRETGVSEGTRTALTKRHAVPDTVEEESRDGCQDDRNHRL